MFNQHLIKLRALFILLYIDLSCKPHNNANINCKPDGLKIPLYKPIFVHSSLFNQATSTFDLLFFTLGYFKILRNRPLQDRDISFQLTTSFRRLYIWRNLLLKLICVESPVCGSSFQEGSELPARGLGPEKAPTILLNRDILCNHARPHVRGTDCCLEYHFLHATWFRRPLKE